MIVVRPAQLDADLTQTGNEAMRTVNKKLGYVTRATCIRVRGSLPLR